MRRTLLIAFTGLLVLPAAAFGGTVEMVGGQPHFVAAPGEVNAVGVRDLGDTWSVADSGAPITAGPGCGQFSPEEARCPEPADGRGLVDGGDGPDVLDARGLNVTLLGGAGDDRLLGGEVIESDCGEGVGDTFEPVDPARIPPRTTGCERVRVTDALALGDVLGWTRRRVRLGAVTIAPLRRIDVVLRMGGRTIGRRRVKLRSMGRRTFSVALTRAGGRRIAAGGWMRVLVRRPGKAPVGFRVILPAT